MPSSWLPFTRVVSKNCQITLLYLSVSTCSVIWPYEGCALRKIEENTVLLTCAIQGAQHINSMGKLRFSSCLGAKVRHQRPLGTCQSTALHILLYDTYDPLYVKVSAVTSNFVRKRYADRTSI